MSPSVNVVSSYSRMSTTHCAHIFYSKYFIFDSLHIYIIVFLKCNQKNKYRSVAKRFDVYTWANKQFINTTTQQNPQCLHSRQESTARTQKLLYIAMSYFLIIIIIWYTCILLVYRVVILKQSDHIGSGPRLGEQRSTDLQVLQLTFLCSSYSSFTFKEGAFHLPIAIKDTRFFICRYNKYFSRTLVRYPNVWNISYQKSSCVRVLGFLLFWMGSNLPRSIHLGLFLSMDLL